jgi:hypothetical protein
MTAPTGRWEVPCCSEDQEDKDYLVRVSIDHTTMLAVGMTSTVIFVWAARYSYVHRGATPNSSVAQLIALLMLAGLLLAWGFRVVIAGVTGANIGGVFFLTMGLPLCAGLVVFAIVRYRRTGRDRPAGRFSTG